MSSILTNAYKSQEETGAEFSKDAEGGVMWALEQSLGKPQPDEEAK